MLDRFFSSETRVDLLELFLSRAEERFYVREIVRELNRDISGIKRELDNLEKAGLLASSKVGNLRYYAVDKTFPLYPELKAIIDKTRGVPQAIGETLRSVPGIRVAIIFGESDAAEREAIDVLVVGRPRMAQLNRGVADLELRIGRSINYLVFDEGEYQRRKAEGDPFLREVLQGSTVSLIGSFHDL
ncbi:MAG: winged helix-turn-helix transcriptional regulator [candidate division NC10 bacterium]|nr:winged helix-turn-helix transcriptional regulator [candidate division NC10 bacterium]